MKYTLILLISFSFMPFQASKTEEQKIQLLISYVSQLKDVVFVRNGSEYSPSKAANHLKTKREHAGTDIKTAVDFINEIAAKSSITGTYYTVKYKDGKEEKVKDLLLKELARIEKLK